MKKRILFLTAAASLTSMLAQADTFTVDTKLVVVNVSVKDKSGKPITSLKKEDFQILEDGVVQKIAVFDLQELSGEPLAPMSFAQRPQTLEERNQQVQPTPTPAPKPKLDPKTLEDHRLIGLFFDMSSIQPLEQARAQE